MRIKVISIAIMFLFLVNLAPNAFAAGANIGGFKFYRDINFSNNSDVYKELFLDKDIYARTNANLSDILIVDEEGSEVPYYIASFSTALKDLQQQYTAEPKGTFVKEKNEFFDFKVNKIEPNTDLSVNIINLDIPTQDFARDITVSGSFDGNAWTTIKTQSIYSVNTGARLRFEFEAPLKYEYFRFKIPEKNDVIKIKGITPIFFQESKINGKFIEQTQLNYKVENGVVKGLTGQIDGTGKQKDTALTVKNENSLKLINLKINAVGDFKRNYEVFDSIPVNSKFLYISGEISNFKGKEDTTISFDKSNYFPLNMKEIVIKIDNLDNKPLEISGINAEYLVDKIVFKPGKGKHRMYFGNSEKTVSPLYDIANFRDKIENESHEKFSFSAIVDIPLPTQADKALISKYKKPVTNGVVIFTAIVLLVIAGMKLKPYSKKN